MQLKLMGRCSLNSSKGDGLRLVSQKSWALLAMLAQHGDAGWSREDLAAYLWPLNAPDQARASLRQELAVLRRNIRMFGDRDPFEMDQNRVSFSQKPIEIDSRTIERIVSCGDVNRFVDIAQMSQGGFASNLSIRSQPFSHWIELERKKMSSLVIFALEAALRDIGPQLEPNRRLEVAQAIIAIDPAHECAVQHAMQSLHASGRDVELMVLFNRLCQTLQATGRSLPMPGTIEIYKELIGRRSRSPIHRAIAMALSSESGARPTNTEDSDVSGTLTLADKLTSLSHLMSAGTKHCWETVKRLRLLSRKA